MTFSMAGGAPQVTVQNRYSAVASKVVASAPSTASSGAWNTVYPSENSTAQASEQ